MPLLFSSAIAVAWNWACAETMLRSVAIAAVSLERRRAARTMTASASASRSSSSSSDDFLLGSMLGGVGAGAGASRSMRVTTIGGSGRSIRWACFWSRGTMPGTATTTPSASAPPVINPATNEVFPIPCVSTRGTLLLKLDAEAVRDAVGVGEIGRDLADVVRHHRIVRRILSPRWRRTRTCSRP